MSYQTDYYLYAEPVDEALHEKIHHALEDTVGGLDDCGIGSWESMSDTWLDCDENLLELSKQFPDVLFKLHGVGEVNGDVWSRYFKNGLPQFCLTDAVERPLIPYRWTGMHRGQYNTMVDDICLSDYEVQTDTIHNLLFQCIKVLMVDSDTELSWDRDMLERARQVMKEFMDHEGLPYRVPREEINNEESKRD